MKSSGNRGLYRIHNAEVGGSSPPITTNIYNVYTGNMVYTLFRGHGLQLQSK